MRAFGDTAAIGRRPPPRHLLTALGGLLCVCATFAGPATVQAQEDVLANSPVARRLLQFRASRHELAGVFGTTLGDAYVRNLLPGARYDWHWFDWLSLGGRLQVGIPIQTAMFEEIDVKVTKNNETFEMEATHLSFLAMAHVSVSPMVGKMLAFSSLPIAYDLHFDLSGGLVSVGSSGSNLTAKIGPSVGVGGGMRIFFSRLIALTLDLQAITANRALSVNRDSKEAGGKTRFNTVANVGLSFFMPPKLSRGE